MFNDVVLPRIDSLERTVDKRLDRLEKRVDVLHNLFRTLNTTHSSTSTTDGDVGGSSENAQKFKMSKNTMIIETNNEG